MPAYHSTRRARGLAHARRSRSGNRDRHSRHAPGHAIECHHSRPVGARRRRLRANRRTQGAAAGAPHPDADDQRLAAAGGRGHARRRHRLSGQARRARPPDAGAAHRHHPRDAARRTRPAHRKNVHQPRFRRHDRRRADVPRGACGGRQGSTWPRSGADRRRKRHRQGDAGARHACRQPARQGSLPHRQPGRDAGQFGRIGAVRPRKGCISGRVRSPDRRAAALRRGHAGDRRDRPAYAGRPATPGRHHGARRRPPDRCAILRSRSMSACSRPATCH